MGRGNLGLMLTFWKADGVPQWTVLVISVVPPLCRRKINISSSAEHLGVGIVPVCFLCALKEGLSGRAGTGVGGRKMTAISKCPSSAFMGEGAAKLSKSNYYIVGQS